MTTLVMDGGNNGGKTHYSHKISETHFAENELRIKSEIIKAFLHRGWQAEVTTMLLPPSRDKLGPSRYLQMTRDALPMFMAFRVNIGRRHLHAICDCSEISPFYKPIDSHECDIIRAELEEALQRPKYMSQPRCPILAEVSVGDAAGEMHVLYNMHWFEEQAAHCILRSRSQVATITEDGLQGANMYKPGYPVAEDAPYGISTPRSAEASNVLHQHPALSGPYSPYSPADYADRYSSPRSPDTAWMSTSDGINSSPLYSYTACY